MIPRSWGVVISNFSASKFLVTSTAPRMSSFYANKSEGRKEGRKAGRRTDGEQEEAVYAAPFSLSLSLSPSLSLSVHPALIPSPSSLFSSFATTISLGADDTDPDGRTDLWIVYETQLKFRNNRETSSYDKGGTVQFHSCYKIKVVSRRRSTGLQTD